MTHRLSDRPAAGMAILMLAACLLGGSVAALSNGLALVARELLVSATLATRAFRAYQRSI